MVLNIYFILVNWWKLVWGVILRIILKWKWKLNGKINFKFLSYWFFDYWCVYMMWVLINFWWWSFIDVGVWGVRNEVDNVWYVEVGWGKLGILVFEMWEVMDVVKVGYFIFFVVCFVFLFGIVVMICEMWMILWIWSFVFV